MECKHFGSCGACSIYAGGYEAQLAQKVAINKERFMPFYKGEIELFASPQDHYRSRAEFKIWHLDEKIYYAMNHQNKKDVVLLEECPQVNPHIEALMPKLLNAIDENSMAFKLFGADFLSSSEGEIVVSLLYHRALDEEWKSKATLLADALGISIIGRSRGQKVVIGSDYVTQRLFIDAELYSFVHIENSFTQPNAYVNASMITWAREMFRSVSGDLLELYCGAGNFTIPFAKLFAKVLATEISKSSINAAKENMALNGVTNIAFVRMSVEEFVAALDGVREFRRMQEIDMSSYDIKSIFVDPPRSGMDERSARFSARYENILYISCNPETLARDLAILTETHEVTNMALFDQFPYTHHVEMGVKLTKKRS